MTIPAATGSNQSPPLPDSRYEDLLATMKAVSHDLRGPLVNVGAALKLLLKSYYGSINENARNEIEKALFQVTGLIGTLEEALAAAFFLDGDLGLPQEILHLRKDLLQPISHELYREMQHYDLAVEQAPPGCREHALFVLGNRFLLRTVFRNLLRNAVEHGEEGCTITVAFTERGDEIKVDIYNTGTPLSGEEGRRLFETFQPVARRDHKSKGLGLGLRMVREIIEKHQGRIWYKPRKHGSSFVFTLPKTEDPRPF
jgi:K+-sensing histidine kinase KdpD